MTTKKNSYDLSAELAKFNESRKYKSDSIRKRNISEYYQIDLDNKKKSRLVISQANDGDLKSKYDEYEI